MSVAVVLFGYPQCTRKYCVTPCGPMPSGKVVPGRVRYGTVNEVGVGEKGCRRQCDVWEGKV